jgi:hypothetical protein
MAEHQAAERANGDRTGLHHELAEYVRSAVTQAIGNGIPPGSQQAVLVLRDRVARSAAVVDKTDGLAYRQDLLHRVSIANDPRAERYGQLLSTVNGWPAAPTPAPSSIGSSRP